jgi:hypothetical protein
LHSPLDARACLRYAERAMPKLRYSKPRRGGKNAGSTKSLRVKLEGLVTPQELRAMLNEAIDRLEALGATHLRACYLYGTPSDARGERVTLSEGGRVVSEIVIDPPYRSAADEHGL